MSMEAKQCPWCFRWCLKDGNCNYIFACGLDDTNIFHIGNGCGKSWCFQCGKKFCGQYYNSITGKKNIDAKDVHTKECCTLEKNFNINEYCEGGHNSHCEKRW